MPKKYDAVFQQRDNRNTKFREVVISGSNLVIQTDANGNLVGKTLGNTFSSASNYYVENRLDAGTIFVRDSITSSVYLANPGPGQVGFIGTSSWAMYAVNGGTQLQTGSLYPITSSWALYARTASYLISGNNYEINNLTASNIYITGQLSASLSLLQILSASLVNITNELIAPRITGSLYGTASRANIFQNDLTVYLKNGKTFGKYLSGETIPATGKTPAEVIELAIKEAIDPTISLTSPTSIAFNQTAISNVLNFSYTINPPATSVTSVSLEWRRNNSGAWTVLTTDTSATTFTHTLTDTNFNTQPFNYRYIVTDDQGGTATATLNITPASYVAPSISLNVIGNSISSPETNSKRERGNTSSTLSGTITRNSSNVALSSYTVQFQINGGAWNDVPGLSGISISGGSASIVATSHTPTSSGTTSVGYRVQVVDAYQTTTSSTSTVTLLYMIYYGPSASAPGDSTAVRALGTRIFTDGSNPYNLITGNSQRIFTSAMPATSTITEVLDLDALNANITANYVLSTFNINDAGGNSVSYNVYTMTNAIAYDSSHRHQTTRS